MASLKREFGGYGLPANPSDGVRPKKTHASAAGGLPRPVNSNVAREPTSTKPEQTKQHHSRIPSRSMRATGRSESGLPVPTSPPQSHEPRRLPSSTSVSGSASSRSRTQGSLDSSSSGISYDSSLKSLGENSTKRRSVTSRNATVPDENRRVSPSPKRQSMASIDEAFDVYLDVGSRSAKPDPTASKKSPDLSSTAPKAPFIYPELDRYRNHEMQTSLGLRRPSTEGLYKLSTHDLPPPTPASAVYSGSSSQLSAVSASPSTKFSVSPGPGPYSRDTTPTSFSSQSPGLVAPSRPSYYTKAKQTIPAYSRPPVTRRRTGSISQDADSTAADPRGLDAVRESVTSSSSSSTVRDGGRTTPRKRSAKILAAPPSPPPRKSSQRFRRSKEDNATEAEKMPDTGNKGKGTTSSPQRPAIPLRPSRRGTPDLKSQLFEPIPVIQSNLRSSKPSLGERRGSESTSHSRKLSSPTKPKKNASVSHIPVETNSAPASNPASRPQTAKSTSSGKSLSTSRFNFFGRRRASEDQEEIKDARKLARKGPAAGTGHEGYGKIGAVRRRSGGAPNTYSYAGPQASQETIASEDSFLADRMNPVVISGGGVIENRNKSLEQSPMDSNAGQPFSKEMVEHSTKLQPSLLPYRENRFYSSSDSEDGIERPTLALRRSVQRLQTAPDSPLRLPQPINTSGISGSPLTSIGTSIMSDDSQLELQRDYSQDSTISQQAPRKLKKKQRSPRKWNFFGRTKTVPEPEKALSATVAATVTAVEVDKRPVPFYAIMDPSEHGDGEDPQVHDVLYAANLLPQRPTANYFEIQHPSPTLNSAVTASTSTPTLNEQGIPRPVRRPSRLQQVGRIPKVATRYHNPASPKSFSRPFGATLSRGPSSVVPNEAESIEKGREPLLSVAAPALYLGESMSGDNTETISPDSHHNSSTIGDTPHGEFLSLSPRKFSVGTACTSSSSSGFFGYAGATAIIPKPDDPPAEDEVWDEYNDLLGEDQERLRRSTTSSRGTPFHLEAYQEKLGQGTRLESPVVAERKISVLSDLSRSSYCSADMTERLRAAFQPHHSTPETGNESVRMNRKSIEPAGSRRHSSGSVKTRFSGSSSSSFDYSSPLAQVNLRVGSMTVSKWLTFGHVLFSDIRHELMTEKSDSGASRHSILVIDGLGNDDWSFYVAETFPKANIYNLSPRAPLAERTNKGETSVLLSPRNHHQVQYLNHLAKFPFAPQSFDSVVYRFPVAAPESHYRNIIAESRRVLKPGGYLELAILDLDLNNMGNRGRRTIRQLKEMIHEQSPTTSLASAADILVKLLGRGGFSGIRAAKVGVPVASSIVQPRSSSGSFAKKPSPQAPLSLSDMMKENGPAADANITKMVTRVGRWWYTRCYENAAGAKEGRKSIWDDKALLHECQELSTSLKLTVCCARAPDRVTSL